MAALQNRRPAGIPSGGQFAPTHRPAVGLHLVEDEPDAIVPQADSVSKIAAVVDAVAAGCVETVDIAEAIGVSKRQGSYYPHAAATLGLVEASGTSPLEWGLTPAGEEFFKASAAERAESLAEAIADNENVSAFVDGGRDVLWERWEHLSDTTIERRVSTIESWAKFAYTTPAADQIGLVADDMRRTRELSPDIRARAETRRMLAKRPVRRCSRCNLELPSGSDLCNICD